MNRLFIVLAALLISAPAGPVHGADNACIVAGRGYVRIRVGTAGIFGAFAHDHVVEAQKIVGCAIVDSSDITRSSIKLNFPAADIRVVAPKESDKNRAEIQRTMQTEVLRVSEYPQVTFESTAIDRAGGGDQLSIHGNLTIRGKTLGIVIPATFSRLPDGTYRAAGRCSFKQSSFDIRPIKVAGGAAKVKDELETEFELYLK